MNTFNLPPVIRGNPFAAEGEWLRGNPHTHSTASDGQMTVREVAAWYEAHGYDFLCITDHDVVAELDQEPGSKIVLIPGAEIITDCREALGAEVCAIGITEVPRIRVHPQLIIDDVLAQGGLPFMSHPHMCGVYSGLLMTFEGLLGIEVFNAHIYGTHRRAFSVTQWDDLLSVGKCIWGWASDDRHSKDGYVSPGFEPGFDRGKAWMMVRTPDRTAQGILSAIRDGLFYSTTGPEIKDIQIVDDYIEIRTSPVKSITLTSLPWCGSRKDAPPGELITETRIHVGAAAEPGRAKQMLQNFARDYTVDNPKTVPCYFRIDCWDGKEGWAWANPWIWGSVTWPLAE